MGGCRDELKDQVGGLQHGYGQPAQQRRPAGGPGSRAHRGQHGAAGPGGCLFEEAVVGCGLRSPPPSSPPGLLEPSPQEPGLGPTTAMPRLPPSGGFSAELGLQQYSALVATPRAGQKLPQLLAEAWEIPPSTTPQPTPPALDSATSVAAWFLGAARSAGSSSEPRRPLPFRPGSSPTARGHTSTETSLSSGDPTVWGPGVVGCAAAGSREPPSAD
ncbi:proline-rich protein HaeIII subfamily 1-like [Eumetopias jubatus]|uniref:proline-rich protein HaeIII subfamily 1-like n=1 Tax=Eumetopias jubatus TaxID=34886 RepID=UPI001015DC07|nr:proline-rich protein HaeIII subfamily 1-like [Eumetopias jubatus]